jgi:nitrogen fixation/metabolism regulation signal transduction histidine kinase
MSYSRYRTRLIIRVILLMLVGLTGLILLTQTPYWMMAIWAGVLLVVQTGELIRFNERSRKSFREFLLSIKQEDFASLHKLDDSDREMEEAYQMILEKFSDLRIQKESHYHYLQQVVEHVDTALVLIDIEENILLINKSAKDLLQVAEIRELRSLEKIDIKLVELIREMSAGQQVLIKIIRHGRILNLSIRMSEFILDKDHYKVISFHDIRTELEEQEVDAWHKLVRVLTHEIRNSTIPITNMIGIARDFLVDEKGRPKKIPGLDDEELSDLVLSLETAESRSSALANFVESTRSLAQLPEPKFETIRVADLFKRLQGIYKKQLMESGISLKLDIKDKDMSIKADPELIEQVVINLVKNAVEALENRNEPAVGISAEKIDRAGVRIRICDNGPGIEEEVLEQIFIPFFSTKEEGSGIGLSLSRQIMKLHRGRIECQSIPGEGTCFILEF